VCREAGATEGRRKLAADADVPTDPETVTALVASVAEEQGLLPEVTWSAGEISVLVKNCSFRELSGADPDLVCAMHRAFLEGILEVITAGLGRLAVDSGAARISRGDDRCELRCSFVAAGE